MPLYSSTVTICSTARLVRGLNFQYQQRQLEGGIEQWQTTQITTLQQWLDDLIANATLLGLLASDALPMLTLSAVAEAYLWEQAITSCLAKHEAAALFDIRAMAKSAIEANNLMLNWQISEADINHHFISQETRQFLRWRHTFDSLCIKQNAIEAARLTALQIALIEQHQHTLVKEIVLPKQIELAGFDRITPLEKHLFEVLKACGVQVEMLATNTLNGSHVAYVAANDSHAECRAAVAWARQKLAENPRAQLAIISPVLGDIRRELADFLDDTFHPEALQSSHFESPRCYDFSLGLALSEYPIVHSALQLLRLASSKSSMSFDEVTPILQDVYWGSQAEVDAKAQLDADLRKNLNASYALETLLKQAHKLQTEGVKLDVLIEHLSLIAKFQTQSQQRQLPSVWVSHFVSLLSEINWADSLNSSERNYANRGLSSHEYQAQQAFLKCLKELSALDAILGNMTANEAVRKLAEHCSATMFQAESTGDVHIQILGLLETPAAQLDAVWALNMNDQHWPPPVKLNPLLPADLQRKHGTPNASANVQSEFAALVHQRLMLSAPEVVFSYALKEDERELRPSPLLDNDQLNNDRSNISSLHSRDIDMIQTLAERLAQPATMQKLDDFMAPAILEAEKTRGGTNLFARQAICPAWAFYQYRLGAGKLETPIDGLDNMSRGSLLHLALQYFWQDCKRLSNLKAMDDEQRIAAIDAAIEKSIHALAKELSFNLPPQILQIEQQRLQQLLQIWLDLERERADFTVQACEQKHVLDIEGLSLNLTIDRIDRLVDTKLADAMLTEAKLIDANLTDGSLVVIDYKTSSAVANRSWADDRIAEPQLPIYTVLALKYEQVVAVCFAKVRSDEIKFVGLSAEEGVLPAVTALANVSKSSAFKRFDDWDSLLEHWYVSLTNIALEIKAGVASVTFNKESDLAYCDVKPLLRLPERLLQFEQMQAALKAGENT